MKKIDKKKLICTWFFELQITVDVAEQKEGFLCGCMGESKQFLNPLEVIEVVNKPEKLTYLSFLKVF